jgi:hypothetical protein
LPVPFLDSEAFSFLRQLYWRLNLALWFRFPTPTVSTGSLLAPCFLFPPLATSTGWRRRLAPWFLVL